MKAIILSLAIAASTIVAMSVPASAETTCYYNITMNRVICY
jgi:hypothetical protein